MRRAEDARALVANAAWTLKPSPPGDGSERTGLFHSRLRLSEPPPEGGGSLHARITSGMVMGRSEAFGTFANRRMEVPAKIGDRVGSNGRWLEPPARELQKETRPRAGARGHAFLVRPDDEFFLP